MKIFILDVLVIAAGIILWLIFIRPGDFNIISLFIRNGFSDVGTGAEESVGSGIPQGNGDRKEGALKPKLDMREFAISSPAFENGAGIPQKYTCDGENISPPLAFSGVPEEAKSLVLIVDDPDAPVGTWVHWIVFNISPNMTGIEEGREPQGTGGANSWGKEGYGGPCPPDREHRYFFKLFALDDVLEIPAGSDNAAVERAMSGRVIASAELVGRYERR